MPFQSPYIASSAFSLIEKKKNYLQDLLVNFQMSSYEYGNLYLGWLLQRIYKSCC